MLIRWLETFSSLTEGCAATGALSGMFQSKKSETRKFTSLRSVWGGQSGAASLGRSVWSGQAEPASHGRAGVGASAGGWLGYNCAEHVPAQPVAHNRVANVQALSG